MTVSTVLGGRPNYAKDATITFVNSRTARGVLAQVNGAQASGALRRKEGGGGDEIRH